MMWLRRHPLIYPIFPCIPGLASRSHGRTFTSYPQCGGQPLYLRYSIVNTIFQTWAVFYTHPLGESSPNLSQKPRRCRVRQSSEPAKAGWVPTRRLRLGSGLSRRFREIETHFISVGSGPYGCRITNTAGYISYTMIQICKEEKNEPLCFGEGLLILIFFG